MIYENKIPINIKYLQDKMSCDKNKQINKGNTKI